MSSKFIQPIHTLNFLIITYSSGRDNSIFPTLSVSFTLALCFFSRPPTLLIRHTLVGSRSVTQPSLFVIELHFKVKWFYMGAIT